MKISYEAISLILGLFSIILIPAIALMVRSAIKWARMEAKVEEVVSDTKELKEDVKQIKEYFWTRRSKDAV